MKKIKMNLKNRVGKLFLEGKTFREISSILNIPIGKGNVRGTVKEYLRCWKISRSCQGRVPWNKEIPWNEEVKKKIRKTQFKKGDKPWNTGKHRSKKTKQKISEAKKGKALSEKHKRRISLGMKNSKKFQEVVGSRAWREKVSRKLKGRKFSKEWREKISNSKKGRLVGRENPAKRSEVRRKISKALVESWQDPNSGLNSSERSQKLRQRTLTQLKKNPIKVSSAEIKLREALGKHSLDDFVPQFQALDQYLIDIAFPKEKLAIECDGSYWHNLPERVEGDKLRDRRLRKEGWKVLRIANKDIHEDIDRAITKIRLTLMLARKKE